MVHKGTKEWLAAEQLLFDSGRMRPKGNVVRRQDDGCPEGKMSFF
jgi:hypothetical protein